MNINRRRPTTRLNDTPLVLEGGKPYRLHVGLLPNLIRITLNGEMFEARGITLPFQTFHIQLMGWQPTNTWRVRNLTIH